jgi:serine/threonine protein kinase
LERSLYFYLAVQSLVDNDPDFAALQDATSWPEAGSHFLGFDLLRELGRGAAGRVFLASERALGERPVVLKVALHGGHEADILGRLRHANIVPIHSIQEDASG